MRVLMFCPQFAPLIGGAERQAERLGKALIARGLDIAVWTPRLDGQSPDFEVLDGLPVRRFPLHDLVKTMPWLRGIGVVNAPWIAAQIIWRLWAQIGRSDIVHCHIGSLQTITVACVARLRGVPVICKAAMADDRSDLGEMVKAGWVNRLAARLGRRIFTRWVATTDAVEEALQRAGVSPASIVVIPNGVETVPADRCWVPRPVRRFLYLGRLSSNTNRDVPGLIQAFDGIAGQVPDAELALVGDGDLLDETRRLVAACAHAPHIQVPGSGDSSRWLAWADCFVLPSRREGLSNALLEAMAHGLPCIANDIPPNREVLANGEVGKLVPLRDIRALMDAMLLLSEDGMEAAKFSELCAKHVKEKYSLLAVADSYEVLYKLIL